MPALSGSTVCLAHSTAATARATREAARQAGGEARARQFGRAAVAADLAAEPPEWFPLATLSDACKGLGYVAREVMLGRMAARDANAATHALAALVPALREAETEERLAIVETALGTGRKR